MKKIHARRYIAHKIASGHLMNVEVQGLALGIGVDRQILN